MLTLSQLFQTFLLATLFVARANAVRAGANKYFQLGDDLDGVGHSVSVSADGTRFVSSNPYSDQVEIYEYLSGAWTQLGDTISVPSQNNFGASVTISADGTRIAIGAVGGSLYDSGYVRVYQEVSGTWTQIGGEIQGPSSSSKQTAAGVDGGIGYSVSMSSDGERLAIGAPTFNSVLIYNYDATKDAAPAKWKQVGSIIDTEDGNSPLFGNAVSLSSNGLRVAIGAMYYAGRAGKVDIYEDMSGTWSKIGDDVILDWAQSGGFEGLDHLNLGWNEMSNEAAKVLANSPTLNKLHTLILDSNCIGDSGSLSLSQSKNLMNLVNLNMANNNIKPSGESALLKFRSRINRKANG